MDIAFQGDQVRIGVERQLFGSIGTAAGFDIAADGKRIVMAVLTG